MTRIIYIIWKDIERAFRVILAFEKNQWAQLRDNLLNINPNIEVEHYPPPYQTESRLLETILNRAELDKLLNLYNSWDLCKEELDSIMSLRK